MSVELVPISEVPGHHEAVFGGQLYDLANQSATKTMLQIRGFHGVLKRHGRDPRRSITNLSRARREVEQGNLETYYLLDTSEKSLALLGMATVVKNLTAYRSRLPLPAALVRRLTHDPKNIVQGPNIAAWVAIGHDQYDHLLPVYSELVRTNPGTDANPGWTLEVGSYDDVHNAIKDSGFTPKPGNGYGGWDDGELKYAPIRYGQMYLAGPDALPQGQETVQ